MVEDPREYFERLNFPGVCFDDYINVILYFVKYIQYDYFFSFMAREKSPRTILKDTKNKKYKKLLRGYLDSYYEDALFELRLDKERGLFKFSVYKEMIYERVHILTTEKEAREVLRLIFKMIYKNDPYFDYDASKEGFRSIYGSDTSPYLEIIWDTWKMEENYINWVPEEVLNDILLLRLECL